MPQNVGNWRNRKKDFLKDKIGVKRFLKALGHSEVYLNEFYYNSSNLKFLELCFKHFMGRAPKKPYRDD